MVELCELKIDDARLVLAPSLGGAIARLDYRGRPVLRPWSGDADNPFTLASNVLVPFSNRISGGGFEWNDTHHAVEANFAGDPFPIHGDGFQRAWEASQDGDSATLTLVAGSIGPWRYRARQAFHLRGTGLNLTLSMTNTGNAVLPFGGGFHPWFPREDQTRLSFVANGLWLEDGRHLPTVHVMLSHHPDRDFAESRYLPEGFLNGAYTGWHGTARIEQGPDAVSCTVTASDLLDTAIVYAPDADTPFFCFEPVSHPVDAIHLPGYPGLRELAPSESLTCSMQIHWSEA